MSKTTPENSPHLFGNMAKSEEIAVHKEALAKANEGLAKLGENGDELERAKLILTKIIALLGLEQKNEVWSDARAIFDTFINYHCWEEAAETCSVLYQSEQTESLAALVQGIWLSVSFPVDPEITLILLDQLIEAMPQDADGAAVAVATAHYVVGTRANDEKFEDLNFLTRNLMARIAKSHSNVETQEQLDNWIGRLELNKPEVFLPRLGMILNTVLDERDWWIDRDALRATFPQ